MYRAKNWCTWQHIYHNIMHYYQEVVSIQHVSCNYTNARTRKCCCKKVRKLTLMVQHERTERRTGTYVFVLFVFRKTNVLCCRFFWIRGLMHHAEFTFCSGIRKVGTIIFGYFEDKTHTRRFTQSYKVRLSNLAGHFASTDIISICTFVHNIHYPKLRRFRRELRSVYYGRYL